jgi:hypothetical protein
VLDAQESLKRNGNEPARFEFDPASVTVQAGRSRRFLDNPLSHPTQFEPC